ncbi:pirin family protein [Polaribacter tangerinus]|uniref:pirin family protein n=1 Tax=Polaribacter tangerinus TaxID=1920034 RepID=UPI000B4BA83D|nr:pirin family protein [Polaribacter tangerinus]
MKSILHKAATRGNADHGWLQSKHTFSFANYYNPDRMNFGVLRVLNDDSVSENKGFGTHPHRDMEIISIPLEGDLKHMDNMGNSTVIKSGDVQVMSAGTGVMHSEYNNSAENPVKFLQIWVLPNKKDVTPRYDQITLDVSDRENKLQQIISPNPNDAGVWIHQDAWFFMTKLHQGKNISYTLKKPKKNGVYVFVLSGSAQINSQELDERDGFGLWDIDTFNISATSDTEILLMEVPMELNN